jgi:UDP-hydrolysing UDP-N-acetyl-D-glucosamine 2-epimerase
MKTSTLSNREKKIVVCSANRAERGLVSPIVDELKQFKNLKVKFFEDYSEKRLRFIHYLSTWTYFFEQEKPDLVVCPCDRIEMLACACAALELGIPIAHFHAGDLGGGIRDDSIRMAISRLSSIMFCETEEAKDFLTQSGEEPWRINVVGSTAFDGVKIPSKKDFIKKYKLPEKFSILLYHPDPHVERQDLEIIQIFIKYCTAEDAVDELVLMYPNNDPGSQQIIERIESYKGDKRFHIIPSFENREDFLAGIKYCHMLIGNSSSMFFEAPYFGTKTLQIGERNKNRVKPKQIIDGGSKRVAKIISELDLLSPEGRERLLRKRYLLLEFQLIPQIY